MQVSRPALAIDTSRQIIVGFRLVLPNPGMVGCPSIWVLPMT